MKSSDKRTVSAEMILAAFIASILYYASDPKWIIFGVF